jgi:hypothetical protein
MMHTGKRQVLSEPDCPNAHYHIESQALPCLSRMFAYSVEAGRRVGGRNLGILSHLFVVHHCPNMHAPT